VYDGSAEASKQVFGPLSVDVARREVLVAEEQIRLTRMQFDILAALAQRGSRVTGRQELLDAVWGPDWAGCADVVDVHIG
jgi:DNA-binding response OmpR family regulator